MTQPTTRERQRERLAALARQKLARLADEPQIKPSSRWHMLASPG